MTPKVSCIMPTCYGDRYIGTAISCWLDQDYTGELELIVLDNNDEPIFTPELVASMLGRVRYFRTRRKPVGALRNEAILTATGDVICVWDEDDWSAPNRVKAQVDRLVSTGKAVTGWDHVLYWDELGEGTYKYNCHPSDTGKYAIGMSHCFWKSYWAEHPYVEQGVEDKIFSDEALRLGQLDSCDAGQLYVGRIHGDNAVKKDQFLGKHKQWLSWSRSEFPQEFFEAINAPKSKEEK